jgi:SAM-dependent methyltransferase
LEQGRTLTPDVLDLASFYTERLGGVARGLVATRLAALWPRVTGDRVLGIGYATPYLEPFVPQAERVLNFMPAAQGVMSWPSGGGNLAALVVEDELPLTDSSIDRILVIHCLETAFNARETLRELWRVLVPGGKMIVVVPNRRGIWARVERTPFGYGRPFSRGQLSTLLRNTEFSETAWSGALFAPPFAGRMMMHSGRGWERTGEMLWPGFAGVQIVEATKLVYQGLPARNPRRRQPAFRPALAPPG